MNCLQTSSYLDGFAIYLVITCSSQFIAILGLHGRFIMWHSFLLSMNEVNIKYWFRNFLDEFELFIEEKPICTKKKFPSPAVCPEKFGYPLLPFPFNLETSPFGLVTDLVPNRSYWFLDFGNKFRRVAPIRIFGSFFTFSWNIDQFHWFDVKFYAELKKVYFMGSKVQLEAFGAQKRNLLVMNFL
jgi:hypothetical protein